MNCILFLYSVFLLVIWLSNYLYFISGSEYFQNFFWKLPLYLVEHIFLPILGWVSSWIPRNTECVLFHLMHRKHRIKSNKTNWYTTIRNSNYDNTKMIKWKIRQININLKASIWRREIFHLGRLTCTNIYRVIKNASIDFLKM